MMSFLVSTQWITERVLNSIPEGLLIAAFAWLVLRFAGRQNSGTRFAVWFAALLAIAAVPFVPVLEVGGTVARAVHAELTLPAAWAGAIFAIWALIALIAGARLGFGLWHVRSLRRNARVLSEVDPVLRETIAQCQAVRPVEVCASGEVRVPTAIGFFHPVILIPEWAVSELSLDELRAIILHEFAHLRRWDDWTNLLQKVVRSAFFFHPAVLWIERRLSLEREMACDDAVLAETENPHVYARCLVSLAERSFLRRSIAVAQAAISRAKDTSLRLAQILDLDRPKATRVFSPAVAAVAAFAGLCFVAIPNAPRLVAFRTPAAQVAKSGVAPTLAAETGPDDISVAGLPKAMVIPAAIHTRVESPEVAAPKVKMAAHRVRKPISGVHEVLAKQRQSVQKPMVVQAAVKQPAAPAPQFVIFTQATEFVRVGPNVMAYSVWRVTLVTGKSVTSKAANQT